MAIKKYEDVPVEDIENASAGDVARLQDMSDIEYSTRVPTGSGTLTGKDRPIEVTVGGNSFRAPTEWSIGIPRSSSSARGVVGGSGDDGGNAALGSVNENIGSAVVTGDGSVARPATPNLRLDIPQLAPVERPVLDNGANSPFNFQTVMSRLDELYKPRSEEDIRKEEQRRRRAALIAAIGDGIRALGNVFFVGRGSKNAYTADGSMSKALRDRWDKLDAEREEKLKAYLPVYMQAMSQYDTNVWRNNSLAMDQYKTDANLAIQRANYELDANKAALGLMQQDYQNQYQRYRDYKDDKWKRERADVEDDHWTQNYNLQQASHDETVRHNQASEATANRSLEVTAQHYRDQTALGWANVRANQQGDVVTISDNGTTYNVPKNSYGTLVGQLFSMLPASERSTVTERYKYSNSSPDLSEMWVAVAKYLDSGTDQQVLYRMRSAMQRVSGGGNRSRRPAY